MGLGRFEVIDCIECRTTRVNFEDSRMMISQSAQSNQDLRNLSKEKLETIKFRFAWIVEDIYDFEWHQEEKKNEKSKDEKKYYDAEIEYIRKNIAPVNNYNSYLYNGNEETKPSDNHEIHPNFLDAICS